MSQETTKLTPKLTPKQRRFCEEYLIDLNGTQAAIRAGYSPKTANEQSPRLLAKVSIQNFLQEKQKALSKATNVTAERVINEFAKIGFVNTKDLFDEDGRLIPVHKLSSEASAAISEIRIDTLGKGEENQVLRTTYKLHSKTAALESLGKHLGIFDKDNKQKTPVFNILNLGSGVPPTETK